VAWCHCGAPVSVFVAIRRDAYEVTKRKIAKIQFVTWPVARFLRQVRVHRDVRR
jgi:hypothetical protein